MTPKNMEKSWHDLRILQCKVTPLHVSIVQLLRYDNRSINSKWKIETVGDREGRIRPYAGSINRTRMNNHDVSWYHAVGSTTYGLSCGVKIVRIQRSTVFSCTKATQKQRMGVVVPLLINSIGMYNEVCFNTPIFYIPICIFLIGKPIE